MPDLNWLPLEFGTLPGGGTSLLPPSPLGRGAGSEGFLSTLVASWHHLRKTAAVIRRRSCLCVTGLIVAFLICGCGETKIEPTPDAENISVKQGIVHGMTKGNEKYRNRED